MKNLKFLLPRPFPYDLEDWQQQDFAVRVKMLCRAWAVQGYGAPLSAVVLYLFKMLFYIAAWFFFCSFSTQLGDPGDAGSWWFQQEALAKALIWSMLFENLGLGCGSGPMTARYHPPFGGALYYLRPGTLKLPMFPGLPLLGGDQRNWLDVILYALHISLLVRMLVAPQLHWEMLIPTVLLLPVLGLADRSLFLSARAEHYLVALFCFLFPADTLSGLKLVWVAIWWWAATSKLNRHFPSVICVMISNHPLLRGSWLKKRLYVRYPDDLRPSSLAKIIAHTGTLVEYAFPLLLIFGSGGSLTVAGLTAMLLFHLFITSSFPMGVPLEWNILMVYGAFVLFGHYAEVPLFAVQSVPLAAALVLMLILIPLLGNLFPAKISFLLSMRYYAGNWPYSIWLFKGRAEEKLDDRLIKSSPNVEKQLCRYYEPAMAKNMLAKVIPFRVMHLQGRLIQKLLPGAVESMEQYTWRDGELIAGVALGWNFGDGHLHQRQLLESIQKRCAFQSGELRCIFVESQPFGRPFLDWQIFDAADGKLEEGRTTIGELECLQPF